jgi:uncharacterized protein YeaO (DUF488 family)
VRRVAAFADRKSHRGRVYSIARLTPKGFDRWGYPLFCPEAGPMALFQRGEITWKEFGRRYRAKLDAMREQVLEEFDRLPVHATLCCYEDRPAECHRGLLAEWLKEQGREIEVF